MDVVLSLAFVPYFNKGQSIVPIDEIFTKTEVQEWKKEQEPLPPVHKPCYLKQMLLRIADVANATV